MVATLILISDNGGTDANPAVETDISGFSPNVKFQAEDVATVTTTNPIVIPTTAGTNYSRWKSLALKCTVAPTNQIDAVVFYTDGANDLGPGIDVRIPTGTFIKNSTADTGYQVSDILNEALTSRSDVTVTTSIFAHNAATSVAIGVSETDSHINAVGEFTNYVIMQMEVVLAANAGETPSEIATIQYDES